MGTTHRMRKNANLTDIFSPRSPRQQRWTRTESLAWTLSRTALLPAFPVDAVPARQTPTPGGVVVAFLCRVWNGAKVGAQDWNHGQPVITHRKVIIYRWWWFSMEKKNYRGLNLPVRSLGDHWLILIEIIIWVLDQLDLHLFMPWLWSDKSWCFCRCHPRSETGRQGFPPNSTGNRSWPRWFP